jgi:hypothetical protein
MHAVMHSGASEHSAVRIDDYKYRFTDQPGAGWAARSSLIGRYSPNLRLDPFERTGLAGSLAYYNWFAYELWRFQFAQKEIAKIAQTAIEFPPMQKGASFNLEAVKERIAKAIVAHTGK